MRIFNRRARRDFQLFEKIETGISLTGAEAKSAREGKINLDDAYVRLKNGQAFLINAHIYPYQAASDQNLDSRRTRKLLLHKKEILHLEIKMRQKNLTIVPVLCYTKRGLVKLEIALARGKREYEHREEVKKKDRERDLEQELTRFE